LGEAIGDEQMATGGSRARFTKQTSETVDVILYALEGLGLSPRVETPYGPEDRSCLCDVTASALPDGKPVFRFEIDQRADRTLWNNFGKYLDRNYHIESLPAIHFAVLWNKAAAFESRLHGYYAPYALPPGFIKTIRVERVDGWEQTLRSEIEGAIQSSRGVGTNTPEDIIKGYRRLIKYGAYEVAARILAARLEDSWASFDRRPDNESLRAAATLECAHVRLLQSIGWVVDARNALNHIHGAVPFREWYRELPLETADLARYLHYRLDADVLGDISSPLKLPANQAKVMWRCPPSEARGNAGVLDAYLDGYLGMAGDSAIPRSNTYLARAKIALAQREWDAAAQYSWLYGEQQMAAIGDQGIPNGGTGPLTAVFLRVLVYLLSSSGKKREDAKAFLKDWDALRRDFGVEMLADGLRDIDLEHFDSDLPFLKTAERSEQHEKRLTDELGSARYERLQELWHTANDMAGGSSGHP
jgi:hypothetical protein